MHNDAILLTNVRNDAIILTVCENVTWGTKKKKRAARSQEEHSCGLSSIIEEY